MVTTSQFYQAMIDRPLGYQDAWGNTYPVNYGYIPHFEGRLAAVIHRRDDKEDKWVLTGLTEQLTFAQITEATHFLEQYFDSWIELV